MINCRKGGTKSSLCDPYGLGYTCATMEHHRTKQKSNFKLISKVSQVRIED